MNVLQNLTELYNHLPLDSTYKEVAKGILMNLEEASNATIYDIAEMTNSSRTTVWRMVQKMGYQNYSDFRYALKQAVGSYTYYNRMISQKRITEESDIFDIMKEQLKTADENFRKYLSVAEIAKLAELIAQKEKVYFYLSYQSSAIGAFQQNLFFSGKETGACTLLPDMQENAELLNDKSMVFIMTIEHAEAQDMTTVFEALKKNNCEVFMVSCVESRYTKYVDHYLLREQPSTSVIADLMFFELYFWSLNEIYRYNYIDNK